MKPKGFQFQGQFICHETQYEVQSGKEKPSFMPSLPALTHMILRIVTLLFPGRK